MKMFVLETLPFITSSFISALFILNSESLNNVTETLVIITPLLLCLLYYFLFSNKLVELALEEDL